MYSEAVTQEQVERIEASSGLKLHRYSVEQSRNTVEYLERLDSIGKLRDGKGRILRREHANFMRNELLLCQWDFFYALRYFKIQRDGVMGGGVGWFADTFWESQRILLTLIAKLEEKNWDQNKKGYPCDGILVCDNKGGRALGHTMIARGILMHRTIFHPHTRGISASVDEDKVQELYDRDKLIIDNLPFFLKPKNWGASVFDGYDKKAQHIRFEAAHGSSMLYQQSNQDSGVGTGRQFDVNHNTELSQWRNADKLELDLFPTLPQSFMTFSLQETTPRGRTKEGEWWFRWSEKVRHGKIPRWAYLFLPFYSEPKKYRMQPPEGWEPSEQTKAMAYQVFRTSKEFVGREVMLDYQQSYWWESKYNEALENNSLNLFLSNFSITPEQSFQHSHISAVRPEIMDWMRGLKATGAVYVADSL